MTTKQLRGLYYKWSNKIMGRNSKKQKRAAAKKARQLELLKPDKEHTNFDTLNKAISDTNPVKVEKVTSRDYTEYTKGISYGQGYHWKSCNHAPVLVCSVGGIRLYAATKSNITRGNSKDIQLIVNCSGISVNLVGSNDPNDLVIGTEKFEVLKKHIMYQTNIEELRLDWTDGGIWPAGIQFWQELFDICKANEFTDIVFCCVGGHGRTGTALVSFAIANSIYQFDMSIDYVKELNQRYCTQAVETMAQDDYLRCLEVEVRQQEKQRENIIEWIAPVKLDGNSAATGTAKLPILTIDLTTDDSEDKQPAIAQDSKGKWCCINCGHLEEFCSCGECPSCKHFADLCECTLSEKYQARKLLKELKELEERTAIAEAKEMTDGEAQELANKALVQEMTKQAIKDYQWK